MTLTLDDNESAVLIRALDNYLQELAAEASRIERGREAHPVWEMHRTLEAIRDRLRGARHAEYQI